MNKSLMRQQNVQRANGKSLIRDHFRRLTSMVIGAFPVYYGIFTNE